eukprot:NODE_396_length_8125_cov_0.508472.p8 type:complete len:109 gc:universal NODE_396_length_8125_cov_0.508472:1196-1522(+)
MEVKCDSRSFISSRILFSICATFEFFLDISAFFKCCSIWGHFNFVYIMDFCKHPIKFLRRFFGIKKRAYPCSCENKSNPSANSKSFLEPSPGSIIFNFRNTSIWLYIN